MAETIDYRGFRLLVSPVGKGWRAMIYAPGSPSALPESPAMLEKSSQRSNSCRSKEDCRCPAQREKLITIVMGPWPSVPRAISSSRW